MERVGNPAGRDKVRRRIPGAHERKDQMFTISQKERVGLFYSGGDSAKVGQLSVSVDVVFINPSTAHPEVGFFSGGNNMSQVADLTARYGFDYGQCTLECVETP